MSSTASRGYFPRIEICRTALRGDARRGRTCNCLLIVEHGGRVWEVCYGVQNHGLVEPCENWCCKSRRGSVRADAHMLQGAASVATATPDCELPARLATVQACRHLQRSTPKDPTITHAMGLIQVVVISDPTLDVNSAVVSVQVSITRMVQFLK
jgi:hypothetical protein